MVLPRATSAGRSRRSTLRRLSVSFIGDAARVSDVDTIVTAYFQKDSPDFVNSRGEVISASKQVDALAQAQSIGTLHIPPLLWKYA